MSAEGRALEPGPTGAPPAPGLVEALYARFRELGYVRCRACTDYVDPSTHDCVAYSTLPWLGAQTTPSAAEEVTP